MENVSTVGGCIKYRTRGYQMTPSQYIKAQGLPSTAYVAKKVGKPAQTICNWYHNNFALFEAVVAGVKVGEEKK